MMSVEKKETYLTFADIYDEYWGFELDESHQDSKFIIKIMRLYAKNNNESELIPLLHEYAIEKVNQPIHPLVEKMFLIMEQYQKSPQKRKIQMQIDSLGKTADPKDELILLMIEDLKEKFGLSAYLVTVDPNAAPQKIVGSCFFSGTMPQVRELPRFAKLYEDIIDILSHDETPRILIIVRQIDHYTVLDFDKDSKQCLILDAANDMRQFNFLKLKDKTPFVEKMIYVKPFNLPADPEKQIAGKALGLQKDTYNCAAYALDHLYVASTQGNLHHMLRESMQPDPEKPEVFFVNWTDFPAEFVRNAISPTFIDQYKQKHQGVDLRFFSDQGLDSNIQKFAARASELLEQHDEQSIEKLKCLRPLPIRGKF